MNTKMNIIYNKLNISKVSLLEEMTTKDELKTRFLKAEIREIIDARTNKVRTFANGTPMYFINLVF